MLSVDVDLLRDISLNEHSLELNDLKLSIRNFVNY